MTYQQFEGCSEVCSDCTKECRACVAAAMSSATMAEYVRACREATLLCELFVADLRSDSAILICSSQMCARACERSHLSCRLYNTEACRRCATACRRCAVECRNVRVWLGEIQLGEARQVPFSGIASRPVVNPRGAADGIP